MKRPREKITLEEHMALGESLREFQKILETFQPNLQRYVLSDKKVRKATSAIEKTLVNLGSIAYWMEQIMIEDYTRRVSDPNVQAGKIYAGAKEPSGER